MQDKILAYFQLATAIDSPSGKESQLAGKLSELLRGMSFKVDRDEIGNIIARRGRGEPLLLCCHMDTVESTRGLKLRFNGDYLTSSGDTILGADDKAGIAVLLAVLEQISSEIPVEILFSVQEEVGMRGAKAADPEWFLARWGLVLDAGEPVGTVINRAPGESSLALVIHGRSAHAAVNPDRGIDALRLAAKFVSQLPPHRFEQDTVYNIGIIQGGTATNTICPRVEMHGEIRSFTEQKRVALGQQLETILAQTVAETGARYEFNTCENYRSYHVDHNHPLVQRLAGIAAAQGIRVEVKSRFAGSDANIINSWRIATVNLGIGVEDGHSFQERVAISELEKLASWLLVLLREWGHG